MAIPEAVIDKVVSRRYDTPSGCLEWGGAANDCGYGQVAHDRQVYYVHRVVWEYHNGPIPDGMYICHHCDNPRCSEIDHLFLGTPSDNSKDCLRKNRARGLLTSNHPYKLDRHPKAKLTSSQVEKLRAERAAGVMLKDIARKYGISVPNACTICKGNSWKGLSQSKSEAHQPHRDKRSGIHTD